MVVIVLAFGFKGSTMPIIVEHHAIHKGQTKEEKLKWGRDAHLETRFETPSQTATGVVEAGETSLPNTVDSSVSRLWLCRTGYVFG